MSGVVSQIKGKIKSSCLAERCCDAGCELELDEAPSPHVLVDMDCSELPGVGRRRRGQKRADFVFFGDGDDRDWVVPIELKSGGFRVSHVVKQLQDTAKVVDSWLAKDTLFRFVPVLGYEAIAHGTREVLLSQQVELRGQSRGIKMIPCGGKLRLTMDTEP